MDSAMGSTGVTWPCLATEEVCRHSNSMPIDRGSLSLMAEDTKIRVDKWLWTARFFKTRSAAASAVTSGRVKVNDERAKPSLNIRVGDSLLIRKPPYDFVITVQGLSCRRGPSKEATQLYTETPKSIKERKRMALVLRAQAASMPPTSKGRPTKRDRRAIAKLKGK
ncbi:RNA-binding S4 domain-containing protein [Myxococcota bacterium]